MMQFHFIVYLVNMSFNKSSILIIKISAETIHCIKVVKRIFSKHFN